MSVKFKKILLFFLIVKLFMLGEGELALAKKILNLSSALNLALKNNPQIQAFIKQKEEFYFQKNLIRSEFFPKIFLNYNYQQSDIASPTSYKHLHVFGPTLNWNIFSGFSTYYAFKSALYDLSAQEEYIRSKILEVVLSTISAYVEYFKNKELLASALTDLEDAKTVLKLAQKRYEVGLSPYADVLDALARLKEVEYKVSNYKYLAEISKGNLLILLNLDLHQIEEYELEPLEEREFTLNSLSEYINKALKLRPELQAKEKEILSQENRIKSVRGEFLPISDLFVNYYKRDNQFFPDQEREFQFGLRISFPLFTGFSTISKLQKEKATYEKKVLEKRTLELLIQQEVLSKYKHFQTTKENLSALQALVEKLKEDYHIIQKKYENGLASIVDVTTIMARLSEARSNLAIAKHTLFYRYFDLLKSVGEIPGL